MNDSTLRGDSRLATLATGPDDSLILTPARPVTAPQLRPHVTENRLDDMNRGRWIDWIIRSVRPEHRQLVVVHPTNGTSRVVHWPAAIDWSTAYQRFVLGKGGAV